ncbi:MAG: DUF5305 family protein [Firmicutes bacterium]|nr:DUF5305 family protein [Bacillota bacterium]
MKKDKLRKKEVLLRNKRLFIGIAAASTLAAVAAVVLFAFFAAGYADAKRPVTLTVKNSVVYKPYYPISAEFPADSDGEPVPVPMGLTYFLGQTEKFELENDCSVTLDKDVPAVSVGYDITATFVVRAGGEDNHEFFLRDEKDITKSLREARKIFEIPMTSNTASAGFFDPYEIDLQNYKARYDAFVEAEVPQSSPSLDLSGGLIIEFSISVHNNNGSINSNTKRDILISFRDDGTYKVELAGQEIFERTFQLADNPFHNIALPLFALLAVGFAITLMFSIKKLIMSTDPYKRAVNEIIKRFGNEIVMADAGAALPSESPVTDVIDFKELTKLSQFEQKPVICLSSETSTLFYIQSGNMLYKYELSTAPEEVIASQAGS